MEHVFAGQAKVLEEYSLYQLFINSVNTNPDKIALYWGQQEMTYRELNQLVDRMATRMRHLFTRQNMNIVYCVERSILQIAGIIALIKEGHVCVPVSPAYPTERIMVICSQVECTTILHDETFNLDECPDSYSFLDIRTLADSSLNDSETFAEGNCHSDQTFVFFTSGSTGRPKGVWLGQEAIINCLMWRKEFCDLREDDVFMYKAPITFDISIWEIFLPLTNGVSLVIANPIGHYVIPYLIKTIEKRKISVIQFVGSVLRKFISEVQPSECLSLRAIFCGGESWNFELGKRVCELFPHIQLLNVYGQTETSLGSSGWKFNPYYEPKCLTIGQPIFNTQYLIISEDEKSVTGMEEGGELYVGGLIVSDGYVGNPLQTEKSFKWIEVEGKKLGRFYKTGDYVKRLEDGNFVFMGRKDNQVKIYGVRVELEEIENLVNDVAGVKASVAVKAGENEDTYVVLFVHTDHDVKTLSLDQLCKKHLPAAMLPRKIIAIDDIPITANGKLDRKYLESLVISRESI
nr:amino acid adenylation domain-containing protein [Paenibacillus polysaccharolyticus]